MTINDLVAAIGTTPVPSLGDVFVGLGIVLAYAIGYIAYICIVERSDQI